jgi:hypothetical protein
MNDRATNPTTETERQVPHGGSARVRLVTGNGTPPEQGEMNKRPTKPTAVNDMTGPTLLIGPQSRQWRRQLGPLAWAALEHLALASHRDHGAWAAPIGVRDLAAGLGVTKDTAARAVAVLAAAGLVARSRTQTHDGRHRSGYQLHLPAGLEARDRAAPGAREPAECPSILDSLEYPSGSVGGEPVGRRARATHLLDDRESPAATAVPNLQPALFTDPGPSHQESPNIDAPALRPLGGTTNAR